MTGSTHRLGGMFCSVVGFAILKEKGLLLDNVNIGVQWLVMYPFTYWGSTASDLDHHWESCPSRDYPSWFIHKVLHLGAPVEKFCKNHFSDKFNKRNPIYLIARLLNSHHRSWQTHSDLTLVVMLFILNLILSGKLSSLGRTDTAILSLVVMGLVLGVIEHFILDMLTPEGITLVGMSIINALFKTKLPAKVHLVPKSKFFATGGSWELFVCNVIKVLTVLSILWLIGTVLIPQILDMLPFNITIGG